MRKVSENKLVAQWGSGFLYEAEDKSRLVLLSEDGEPMMSVSKEGNGKGLYAVKDYSENEGILDAMLTAGLVEETGRVFPAGFTVLTEVRLLK